MMRADWDGLFLHGISTARRAVSKKDHTVLFPPSRQESFPRPKLGIRQRAEQGAHFLRTYYPDVDVASELIREELEIDARVSSSMETFDPFAGNLLTSFRSHGRTRTKTLYIAFPMGETASDLNISPLQFARNGTATFTPSVSAIRTFNTSIRQLISSTSLEPNPYDGYLAVRTYGLVTLLGINSSTQGVQLQDIVNVARSEAGDRPIMDMAFSKASVVLVVNDRGDVYGARSNDEQIILRHRTATAGNSSVWKLAHTTSEETALLMSASNLSLLDLRTEDTALRISPELEAGETMVFAENMDADYIVRATSTDRLFWMDVRYQQRPLLAIKHGHRSDRTLRTNTVIFNKDPLTFLTSDRHGLVTVYDVSEQGNLLHLNKTPYTFEVDSREYQRYNGRIFVRNPMQPKALMLGLSGRGSLHCTEFELHCGRADDPVATGSVLCERPSVLQDLPKTKEFPSYSESLSSRSLSEADLHSAYLHILTRSTTLESEDAQQTYETLESMGTFWQEVDAPVEHMLTTFDVSFRAGNEPSAASRADFFTGSALNTKRGVRALMQGRLPLDRISEKSAWHINLSAPLSRHVPSMATSPQATMQNLERYNLHSDDYRSGSSTYSPLILFEMSMPMKT
ncbi:hypothetical protein NM688_g8056 [Phlebia brevispora]|uniref:Uncharacterized protein n=1 Tax=Phlebia brevispora TaxID=194682 RepID=A0ACC1RXX9_9APHY|nr:hypothetical protein NM688_g8056 [Phlebia brevispora]